MPIAQDDRSPARVRIQALGGYRIVVDGRDLRLRTRKEALLLLRLAFGDDEGVSRDECVGLLWPESSEARARHSLSEALRGIEMATRLEVTRSPERLSLAAALVGFDVRELDDAIAAGDVTTCARLHKGGFLAGWYPPTAEASHWVDAVAAGIAIRLEKMLRRELAARRQATDGTGVSTTVALLEQLGVATAEDREAGAEAEQITAWESLRPGESVHRIPLDREGPFVGRVEEMRILTAELERAMKGEVRVVLVSGEPGIGKTRTCQRLARLAALRGARLFLSTCYELEQSVAYGAISEAFAESVLRNELSAMKPAWREALQSVLIPLEESENNASSRPTGQRTIQDSFANLIQGLGATRTAFLLVDDLQWADATSCQILHYILRSAKPKAGALILLSYRPGALNLNSPARGLYRSCEGFGAVRVRLGSMTPDEIRQQIHNLWPGTESRSDEIAALSSGNPFFARELAMAEANGGSDGKPGSLREVIRTRTETLSTQERQLMELVAVAGAPISLVHLSHVLSENITLLISRTNVLAQLRLVREDGGEVVIAHEITRDAVYSALSESVRTSLHGAIAIALEGQTPASFLAHHYSQAGIKKEARLHAMQAAAHSRERKAFVEELRWLLLAMENTEDAVVLVLDQIVDRMFALAKYSEASRLLKAHAKNLTPHLKIKADLALLKSTVSPRDDYEMTLLRCDELFSRAVELGADRDAIETLREKIRFAQEARDTETMLRVADELSSFGERSSKADVRAHAMAISLMKMTSFRPFTVRKKLDELVSEVGSELPSQAELAIGIADALDDYNNGRMTQAGIKFHGLVSRARASGNLGEEARYRMLLVPTSSESGRYQRAIRHARFVFEYARFADASWENLMTLVNLATAHWEEGNYADARACAESALQAEIQHPMWLMRLHALAIAGLCDWEQGDRAGAERSAERLEDCLPKIDDWIGDMSHVVMLAARVRKRSGKHDHAADLLTAATAMKRGFPRVFYWQLAIERARLGLVPTEEAIVDLTHVIDEAQLGSCRLIAAKARLSLTELQNHT